MFNIIKFKNIILYVCFSERNICIKYFVKKVNYWFRKTNKIILYYIMLYLELYIILWRLTTKDF